MNLGNLAKMLHVVGVKLNLGCRISIRLILSLEINVESFHKKKSP